MVSIPVVAIPSIRLATAKDKDLPAYDYTLLSAINTCPKWGVIRYEHGKAMPGSSRPVALEMGALLHEAFAVCRIGSLIAQGLHSHASTNAIRLFGVERAYQIIKEYDDGVDVTSTYRACLMAMDTFGWEDSPHDRLRTMSNAQDSMALYVDDWCSRRDMRVWVASEDDPSKPVGVEIKFDLVLSFRVTLLTLAQLSPPAICVTDRDIYHATVSFRYIGRMDGLMRHGVEKENAGTLFVHENKSTGRINDAWRQSYLISHQITGYCVAGSMYAGVPVFDAYAIGLVIPRPKRDVFNAIVYEHVMRQNYNVERWLQWVLHSVEVIWRWSMEPLIAPMYSHSCSRYFRPCPFIPLCYSEPEEQMEVYDEMVLDKWSPLREFNQKAETEGDG